MRKDILVPNIDLNLLRKQSHTLALMIQNKEFDQLDHDANTCCKEVGLVSADELFDAMSNLLDTMLDIAEGYIKPKETEKPKFQCMICCIYYTQSQILEANNPFDASDVIYGCPGCFSINKHQKIK